jgi:hypothetical protein
VLRASEPPLLCASVLCAAAAAAPAATSSVLCAGQRLLRASQPVLLQREISSRAEVVISPVAVREQGIRAVAGTAAVAPYYLIKHRHLLSPLRAGSV